MEALSAAGEGGHADDGLPWDAAGLASLDHFADELLSFSDEEGAPGAMLDYRLLQQQLGARRPGAGAEQQESALGKRAFGCAEGPGGDSCLGMGCGGQGEAGPSCCKEEGDDGCRGTDEDYASSKACREKARRSRLNDRFAELAKLLEEPGQGPKTDKSTILISAIGTVTNLRREIGQLRQLNKYLEERVAQNEKERAMQMYRQVVSYGPPGVAPSSAASEQVPLMFGSTGSMGVLPPACAPVQQISSVHMGQMKPGPMMMPAMGVPYSYLPQSSLDISQDHMLRPPVA